MININKAKVSKIEQLDDFEDEYVYDIGVDNDTPYFFGNDILLHNSSYFSAYNLIKNDPSLKDFEPTKESMIELYDSVADIVNDSFPDFMQKTFNTSLQSGKVIKAGRELVASKGIFIKKKRYAVLVYDKEGTRLDVNGKPGKIKAMGLDLKRADTPKIMQDFLEEVLTSILTGAGEQEVISSIKEFRKNFRELKPWEKGSPKRVNGLGIYQNKLDILENVDDVFKVKGVNKERNGMPGHVLASINWNKLKKINNDKYSMDITDGQKVIVCKLRPNILKMTSVAYPYDETKLPEWFTSLTFDEDEMENIIIDKKIENLIGILNWDLSKSKENTTFDDLFEF